MSLTGNNQRKVRRIDLIKTFQEILCLKICNNLFRPTTILTILKRRTTSEFRGKKD